MPGGLINDTYAVDDPTGAFILQRVNPIFDPVIHHNIVAVCERLRARGMTAPRLVASDEGRAWVDLGAGGVWRVMTRIDGRSSPAPRSPAQAARAGALVARFHTALVDLEHEFVGVRRGVHDTARHLATLERALQTRADHPAYGDASALADQIQEAFARELPPLPETPKRVAHGDLKFSNVIFRDDEAVCLIDLDTLARMPLHHELGDAWRSWCNPGGEDQATARFDEAIFAASLVGYQGALGFPLTPEERHALVYGVEWIALELSARFCADALEESYFRWDRSRFARAAEHNLLRARGQLALYRSARASRSIRERLLQDA
ncbi:MAG: phosphotransferase [Myxococcales bacterium]|nr:phosphotransferase [Myxococcales bacterium]